MLPFKTGQIVLKNDFCGRAESIRLLGDYISSGNRVYVQGERRVGKSSLVIETVRRMKGWRLLNVNLMNVQTATDVGKSLARALITMEADDAMLVKLLKQFAALRPTLAVDPLTSQPSLSFAPGGGTIGFDTIEGVLSMIRSRKNIVVFFDEFQDVGKIKDGEVLLARLRGVIQTMTNVPFVYAGSLRNRLDRIFTHPDSPFYKSAMKLSLGPIEDQAFSRFIRKNFSKGKRKADAELLRKTFEMMRGNPGDIQKLCIGLWEVTNEGDLVKADRVAAALDFIWSMEGESYATLLSDLSAQQHSALKALAVTGPSKANLNLLETSDGIQLQQSLRKALNRLVERRLATEQDGEYRFCDPFLCEWVREKMI